MADLNITDQTFQKEVVESKGLVIVDFWAAWCGPCRMVSPVIDELAKEYAGKVKIVKVNVDENSQVVNQYSIMSLPSVVFFKDGQPFKTMVGAQAKESYKEEIEQLLAS